MIYSSTMKMNEKNFIIILIFSIIVTSVAFAGTYDDQYNITFYPNNDYIDNEWNIWWTQTDYLVAQVHFQYIGPNPTPNRDIEVKVTQLQGGNPLDPDNYYLQEIPFGSTDIMNFSQPIFYTPVTNKITWTYEPGVSYGTLNLKSYLVFNLRFRMDNPRGPGDDPEYYGSYYGIYRLEFFVREYTTGGNYTLVPLASLDFTFIAYYIESDLGETPPGEPFRNVVVTRKPIADNIPIPYGTQISTYAVGDVAFLSNDVNQSSSYYFNIKPANDDPTFRFTNANNPSWTIPYQTYITGRTSPENGSGPFILTVPTPPYGGNWQDNFEVSIKISNTLGTGLQYAAGNYSSTIVIELVYN